VVHVHRLNVGDAGVYQGNGEAEHGVCELRSRCRLGECQAITGSQARPGQKGVGVSIKFVTRQQKGLKGHLGTTILAGGVSFLVGTLAACVGEFIASIGRFGV
jgi:hypothetical protein